jgi:hypothetical protein
VTIRSMIVFAKRLNDVVVHILFSEE